MVARNEKAETPDMVTTVPTPTHDEIVAKLQMSDHEIAAMKFDPKNPPKPDDHDHRCKHGNMFNHCRGCMIEAGIKPREQKMRYSNASHHIQGLGPVAPVVTPPVRTPAKPIKEQHSELIGSLLANATKKR